MAEVPTAVGATAGTGSHRGAAAGASAALATLGDVLRALPVPENAVGTGVTGFVLVAAIAVVWSAVRRWRASRSTAGTRGAVGVAGDTGDDGHTVRTATRSGASAHDVAFTLPSVLPLSKGVREVTHDEVHAVELGLVAGAAVSWLIALGRTDPAISLLVAFVAGGLGYRRYKTKAFATLRKEPWYGLVAFAIGAGIGYLLFFSSAPALAVGLP